MTVLLRLCILGLALAPANLAFAQSTDAVKKRYTKVYSECLDSEEGSTTYGMQICANAEYDRQDARLNQAYKMVMDRQSPKGKSGLRNLQRAWIKERDQICLEERAEWEGGTGAPFAWKSCMINQTIKRTMWLEKYR